MKVLSITSVFPNKKDPNRRYVFNRLKALNEYAHIEVISPLPYFPLLNTRFREVPFKEKIGRLIVYHPKFFSIPKFFKFLDGYFFYLSLKKFEKKIKQADIIDAHFGWPDGYGAWSIAERHKKKFSITLRGKDITYWPKKFLIGSKLSKMLNRSDIVIFVSNFLKEKTNICKGIIIPNGIETPKFKPFNKKESRERLGLEFNKKIFLTVGNDFKRKGYFELINAFDKLGIKDKLLLVIGYDKKEMNNLKKEIKRLNSRLCIKLLKELPHHLLPQYYSASDVYCLVSHSEGWPNSVMEALACGKPCVVTKEAAGEFITKDLGIVTDYQNLTGNLEKALNKKWDKQKILKFARENSWDKTAKEVYKEFKKIIKEPYKRRVI